MANMKRYTFKDGHQITSRLDAEEILRRMDRLDWLRVLTEGYEEGTGRQICEKSIRAYEKAENFTGIIRLSIIEKDFISMMMEGNTDQRDIETLSFYLKY